MPMIVDAKVVVPLLVALLQSCDPAGDGETGAKPRPNIARSESGVGLGDRENTIGRTLANISRLRATEKSHQYDVVVVELLRLQCRDARLPDGVELSVSSIDAFLPVEYIADVEIVYCGTAIRRSGEWMTAKAFVGWR